MLQRSPIASRRLYVPKTIFQIRQNKVGGDVVQHRLAACKPCAETSGYQNLPVDGLRGVSLLA